MAKWRYRAMYLTPEETTSIDPAEPNTHQGATELLQRIAQAWRRYKGQRLRWVALERSDTAQSIHEDAADWHEVMRLGTFA